MSLSTQYDSSYILELLKQVLSGRCLWSKAPHFEHPNSMVWLSRRNLSLNISARSSSIMDKVGPGRNDTIEVVPPPSSSTNTAAGIDARPYFQLYPEMIVQQKLASKVVAIQSRNNLKRADIP